MVRIVTLSRLMTLVLVAALLGIVLVAGADARPSSAMFGPTVKQSTDRKAAEVQSPAATAFGFTTASRFSRP